MKKILRILGFVMLAASLSVLASDYVKAGKEKGVKKKSRKEMLQVPSEIKNEFNQFAQYINSDKIINFLKENPQYREAYFIYPGLTPTKLITEAVGNNLVPVVKYLLENKVDINTVVEGINPLLHGASHAIPEVIQLLLDAGADVNVRDDKGRTALMKAIARSNSGVVGLLLSRKPDLNSKDEEGNTALMYIVDRIVDILASPWLVGTEVAKERLNHSKQRMLELVQHGANPLIKNNSGKNILGYFLSRNKIVGQARGAEDIPGQIANFIQDIMQQYSEKHEMEVAMSSSLPPELRGLIGEHEIGPRTEQKRRFNNAAKLIREFKDKDSFLTALKNEKIIFSDDSGIVKKEKEVPADLENSKFSDELGYTLFHIAADQCEKDALEVLIDQVKDIHTLDAIFARKSGIQTPLELARARYEAEKTDQCKATVDLLQKYKVGKKENAQKSKASPHEITAIFDAVASKAKGAAKDIIDYIRAGKDVNLKELESGKTLLMHAVQANNKEAVTELLAAKADANAVDDQGNTALIYAVEQGDPDIVQMLLARMTSDVIRKVNKGENALSLAELELAKGMGTLEGERKKITGHQSEITEQQPDQKVKKFEFSKATAEQKKALAEKMALGVEIDKLSNRERRYLEIVKMLQGYEKAK